jgi:putative transposase
VKDYVTDEAYLYWSLASVYCQMLRTAKTFMSLDPFPKYAKLTNHYLSNRRKKLQKNWIGLKAAASKHILHMDVTIFRPSDHSRVYLYFIFVNFSRAILGWKASLQYSSEITLENLKEVCEKYDLPNSSVHLVVDDGRENNGCVNDFLSIPGIHMKKLIAQVDIRQSNCMIEAANKPMKYDYLFTKELPDFHATKTIYPGLLNPLIINFWMCYPPTHLWKYCMEMSQKKTVLKIKPE